MVAHFGENHTKQFEYKAFKRQDFSVKNKDEKEEAFIAIRSVLLENTQKEFKEVFSSLLSNYKDKTFLDLNELLLSWDDIRTMTTSRLCTIGAHTKNHLALNKLDEKTALDEITCGKEELENKIGKPVLHMAYPYGSSAEVSEREYGLAKSAVLKPQHFLMAEVLNTWTDKIFLRFRVNY